MADLYVCLHGNTKPCTDCAEQYSPKSTQPSEQGKVRDWTIGDVIAAYPDGTIVLDDGLTTWNDIRAKEFLSKDPEDYLRRYEVRLSESDLDRVVKAMDDVVDAAVEWHQSGQEGDNTWPDKAETLGKAVDALLELRDEGEGRK